MSPAEQPVRSIAVLGTGIMGAAMARNLLAAGFEVRAWNRSTEKARPLADDGASVAGSAREAVEGADALLTMLADGDAVEAALDGVLDAASDDAVWLQMSTVGLEAEQRLRALAADHGVAYVDAPVLGTKQPAEQGELIVLAAGEQALRDRVEPALQAMGRKTLWLGEAGEGSKLKVVANSWIVGLVAALAETIGLAQGLGVEPERFLQAIEGGPLDSGYAQLKGQAMIAGQFDPSFTLALARKDNGLVLEAAASAGVSLRLAEATAAQFDRALELGHGDDDLAAVIAAVI